jgi:hypothetical protein
VGSAAGGGFVVVWSSSDQDGDSDGVFGQRFDAAGAAQAGEFLVNTYTTGSQYAPVVGVAPDGDFVVVWESDGQDGRDIFARRFDAAGMPLAPEFQVNEHTGSFQVKPAVAVDADGDFVVAWDSLYQDGDSSSVFARRFDSAGVAQAAEFQVNSYTAGDQYDPAVAADADGDFVIAWTRFDGGAAGVAAQRFDSGGAAQGIEFLVNTSTIGYQHRPVVVMRGGFVVVWQSYGQDGEENGVFARSFDSAGAPQTAELQVNTHTANHQSHPAAALSGSGELVVAWDSGVPGEFDVVAQRFATLAVLDVDGNGTTGALTDGLLIVRFLFGLNGSVLTNAVVGPGCTRCDAASIEAYLQSLI